MILSDLSIKRPIFATVMMLALVTFGFFSYQRLAAEFFPNVEFPLISVITTFPGASPETVEREISKRIEDSVNQIAGVKHVFSTSREGVSTVMIQFQLEQKVNDCAQEVRAKIGSIRGTLPEGIDEPIIQKLDFNAAPVTSLAVQSTTLTPRELTIFVEKKIKKRFESVSGVGKVEMVGGQKREICVELDPARLDALSLGVNEVVAGIRAENTNTPLGRLTRGNAEYPLRIEGKPEQAEDYRLLAVAARNGRAITLGEVARVSDSSEERRKLALINGEPAIGLDIYKQSGGNEVQLVDAVVKTMGKVGSELPPGVTVTMVRDGTIMTRESLIDVKDTLIIGGILTVLIVFFFINSWRSTVITGVTLPISVISAFTVIYGLGMTLNVMTLMALSLAIGLLIDDAIVVRENIVRHLELGKDHMEASRFGTSEIGLAVFATTMSIVAVFVPVAFMRGIIGRVFYQFGVTVAFAVLISLFVSFTLDPMLSSRWHDPSIHIHGRRRGLARWLEHFNLWFDASADRYRGAIGWALDHRKSVMLGATAAFVAGLLIFATLESSFSPSYDKGEFQVSFKTAPDASLAETENRLREILQAVRELPEIDHTYATIGAGDNGTVRDGILYLKLKERDQRAHTQFEVQQEVRLRLGRIAGITFSIDEVGQIGGTRKPLLIDLKGDDLKTLKRLGLQLKEELYRVPGIVDLEVSQEYDIPEYRLRVDREKALSAGVTTGDVVSSLSRLVGGEAVTTYEDEDGDAIDVRVRLPETLRQNPVQVLDLKIAVADGGSGIKLIPLASVMTTEVGASPTEISRRDLARQITVSANLDNLPIGTASKHVEAAVAKIGLPPGYAVGLSGEAEDMVESFGYMGESLLLAVILVYLILAAQFESFFEPFAIMLSLPLSIVGMAGMLRITGDTISIMSLIGLIMLMGLVTKNAILLVDYAKVLQRRDGLPRRDAVILAGRTRLRPIIMTTTAMVCGMLPLFFGLGAGGELRAPMARAVVGGLITSTVLTLIVVPVMYTLMDDLSGWLKRRWQRGATTLTVILAGAAMAAAVPVPTSATEVRQLTLEEALALVPQGSREVARANEYGAQVHGRYREERAAAFPQFNLVAGTTRLHDPWQGNPDWREERVTLDVTQPLYTWGKLSAAIRAAEIGLQTAEERRRGARQGALAEVAAAFADVLLAHDLEAIARRDLEQKEARRDEAQRRLAAGVVTEYDLLVTQVALENARPELIRRSNQVEIGREHLRFLLALTEEVDVLGPLPLEFPSLPSFDEAREAALRQRPDLAELRQRIAVADELVTIARTGNRPRIDVKGSAGYLWSDVSGRAEVGELWQAGLYLSWPVFDGLRSSGRTMQAESELRALRIDEAEQLDNLTVQVREALNAAGEAEAIVRALADTEKQARQLLGMAEKGLEYGVKIRLDVADAELNLLQAQANLARARRDNFVARTHLRWVMGELGEERQVAQAVR